MCRRAAATSSSASLRLAQSGFSTKTWTPASSSLQAMRWCRAGGRGDHGGVDPAEQAGVVGQGFGVALGGHPVAIGRQRIDHGQQFNVVAGGEFLGVEPAQASRADHGHSEFFHSCEWSVCQLSVCQLANAPTRQAADPLTPLIH